MRKELIEFNDESVSRTTFSLLHRYLIERAKELQRRKDELLPLLRKRDEPRKAFEALQLIPRIMADSKEPLEIPFRLILREIQYDLSVRIFHSFYIVVVVGVVVV
jgi:hypothetical protein